MPPTDKALAVPIQATIQQGGDGNYFVWIDGVDGALGVGDTPERAIDRALDLCMEQQAEWVERELAVRLLAEEM